jgi:hypothetical protein
MTVEDRSAAATFASWYRRCGAIFFVLFCALIAVRLPFDKAHWWQWARRIPTPAPAIAAYLTAVAIASGWLLYRACRLEARFDDRGITIRKLLKTNRYSWPKVIRFEDGWVSGDQGSKDWALRVVFGDRKAVTAKGTSGKNQSANLVAIRQVAARYQIPAELTGIPRKRNGSPVRRGIYPDPGGEPGRRHWNGREWSPHLWLDPADGKEAGQRAVVWAPLPGSERYDAAARARRAGIWSAAALAMTVAGLSALALDAVLRNPGLHLTGSLSDGYPLVAIPCMMALFGFVVTVNRWQVRKEYRELEQARNPWAGAAVTEDRVASPRNGPGKDPA